MWTPVYLKKQKYDLHLLPLVKNLCLMVKLAFLMTHFPKMTYSNFKHENMHGVVEY